MDIIEVKNSVGRAALFEFSRSGGPGGQNVNKVNTKVTLKVAVDAIEGLNETERRRLREKLAGRINGQGFLVLQVQDERSQKANRATALERLFKLVLAAAKRPTPRIPTKPGKAAKQRRLSIKKARSQSKIDRRKPVID
ncbi:MAG: aminoacyl-tRNA hydrolase [Spirochaetia bacterium]|jgi:ribosome-associated protein|uniref:Peptidyl-tRNA hydrolase ArfB n=2 Tax=root TaxID=1 RepID=A0A652ZWD0_9SPIR|nr:aminoacyl-tRNA hydrolase [Spirochaetia bacterium]MCE1210265.1 aminoacyl-tRNA hydrolase [Spirochaetia bacterium]VBB40096.1 Peptidyl-tRNA hydrolase ArfB [uncultured Spirochaetota bacterium]HAP54885.1 aminoacyl-tRNA hydrolase [Spirochaetaceae bacterium]